ASGDRTGEEKRDIGGREGEHATLGAEDPRPSRGAGHPHGDDQIHPSFGLRAGVTSGGTLLLDDRVEVEKARGERDEISGRAQAPELSTQPVLGRPAREIDQRADHRSRAPSASTSPTKTSSRERPANSGLADRISEIEPSASARPRFMISSRVHTS